MTMAPSRIQMHEGPFVQEETWHELAHLKTLVENLNKCESRLVANY